MRRSMYFVLAVFSVSIPARAHAQSWDFGTQCTTGALRSCAATEIGLAYDFDRWGLPISLLLVRLSNVQNLGNFHSGPRGLKEMTISGLEGVAGDAGLVNHHATEGAVTTAATLDFPSASTSRVNWRFDHDSYLFGCLVQQGTVQGWPFYDSTCDGFITYAVPLRGEVRFANGAPTVSYGWRAWESGDEVGQWSSCTTAVDCATVTPEPVTSILMGTGLAGLAGIHALRRRRRPSADALSS